MPSLFFAADFLLVLLFAFFGGLLAKKLKQPIITGYLVGGLFASFFSRVWGVGGGNLTLLSEIGLALLMFSIGLEFSLKRIEKIRKKVIWGTVLQTLILVFVGTLILKHVFNLDLQLSLLASSAFALSSAAMVTKILQDKNQLESLPGELMIGWVLVQDLLALPLSSLLPLLAGNFLLSSESVSLLFKAAGLLLLAWVTKKLMPKFSSKIDNLKSRELLLILALIFTLFFALISSFFGFSFVPGAFLAGLILSSTNVNHAIFSEVRPLKDFFLAIFFISLGLSIDPFFIIQNIGVILLIGLIFLLLKVLTITAILSVFGYHAKVILKTSFGLAQVGEFSFAFVMSSFAEKSLNSSGYSLVISVTLFTMILTPLLFSLADKVYSKASVRLVCFPNFYKRFFVGFDKSLPLEEIPFENHVVILGYGRVGKWIGNVLDKEKVPYLVVEYNSEIVRELRLEGKKVVFGDPSDLDTLDFAQVDKARLVVVAIPDPVTQKIAITNCKLLNPKVKLICRSHVEEDLAELKSLGADNIIQPEFEAALSISHRALQGMGFGKEEINEKLREVKSEHERR